MKIKHHIGLIGGTFDPIHLGHLDMAKQVLQHLCLDQIIFIPCHQPAHKALPLASDLDRKTMIELAISDEPQFALNTLELERPGVSYTIETLRALSSPDQIFYFVIGFDAFLQFHTWKNWQNILDYCHLIVVNRPLYTAPIPSALEGFYQKHQTRQPRDCRQRLNGRILMLNITPSPVSATAIREARSQGTLPKHMLPSAVWDYIEKHHLYAAAP